MLRLVIQNWSLVIFSGLLIGSCSNCDRCDAQIRRGGYGYYNQSVPQMQAQPRSGQGRLDVLVDGHDGYNSGDVADMPTGTDKLYMTLVTSDDWQTDPGPRGVAQRKLKAWLENDKRLIQYRANSNFNWYLESDPHFNGVRTLANGQASSLRKRFGEAFPILGVENASGECRFKISGLSLPANAGELADWMTSSLKAAQPAAPRFAGQTEATPVVTEGLGQCGPDGCPDYNTPAQPVDNSEVIQDTPRPFADFSGLAAIAALGVCGLFAAGIVAAGVLAPIKR